MERVAIVVVVDLMYDVAQRTWNRGGTLVLYGCVYQHP